MAEKKVNENPTTLVEAFRETNQSITKTIVEAQERNIQFAQSTLANAMEVFKHHMESTSTLMKELEEQTQKQQETFQQLVPGFEGYRDFFRAPLASYQQMLTAAETSTRQGLESFQKAIDYFQQATQRNMENFQKTTQVTSKTKEKE